MKQRKFTHSHRVLIPGSKADYWSHICDQPCYSTESSECVYYNGLFKPKHGRNLVCKIHVPYSLFDIISLPCPGGGVECPYYRPRKPNIIYAHFTRTQQWNDLYPDDLKTWGLPCNYLCTGQGVRCAKCGRIGKHYLLDKSPLLYRYQGSWFCRDCLPLDEYGDNIKEES